MLCAARQLSAMRLCLLVGHLQSQACMQNAMGEQALSTKPSAPRTRFGSSKRSDLASGNAAPGPGTYKLKSTLGATQLKPILQPTPRPWLLCNIAASLAPMLSVSRRPAC